MTVKLGAGSQEFADWVLSVGDDRIPRNNAGDIELPNTVLKPTLNSLIAWVYEDLHTLANNSMELGKRAILAPTNEEADQINRTVCSMIPGSTIKLNSADSVVPDSENDQNIVTIPMEYLNSLNVT